MTSEKSPHFVEIFLLLKDEKSDGKSLLVYE
nr:MAG TPA: hypothetical protein [Caudoviricetes sp.]